MFTDNMKFRFGFIFIGIFLVVMGVFMYLGWRQGEKFENQEAKSIVEDLEVMTGQLTR